MHKSLSNPLKIITLSAAIALTASCSNNDPETEGTDYDGDGSSSSVVIDDGKSSDGQGGSSSSAENGNSSGNQAGNSSSSNGNGGTEPGNSSSSQGNTGGVTLTEAQMHPRNNKETCLKVKQQEFCPKPELYMGDLTPIVSHGTQTSGILQWTPGAIEVAELLFKHMEVLGVPGGSLVSQNINDPANYIPKSNGYTYQYAAPTGLTVFKKIEGDTVVARFYSSVNTASDTGPYSFLNKDLKIYKDKNNNNIYYKGDEKFIINNDTIEEYILRDGSYKLILISTPIENSPGKIHSVAGEDSDCTYTKTASLLD